MRIIFMGTPSFAVASLKALHEHHEVLCAVTRPDAPSKRGKKLYPSEVKACALELGIKNIIEAKSLKSQAIQDRLASLKPDAIIVAAYGAILPQAILELAPCINVHASLLPRWRGAAPIERAILAGDKVAGVSIMKMEEGLDTGDYCYQISTEVGDKSAAELEGELAHLGADALIKSLDALESGKISWTAQDESYVTYAHKIDKSEMILDPSMSVEEFLAVVQASADSYPAKLKVFDRTIRVLKAKAEQNCELDQSQAQKSKKTLVLRLLDGCVSIREVKPDGKKEMPVQSFIAGIHEEEGSWSSL